jgi:hypothetical protein
VTKYRTTIGQASRNAAMVTLKEVTTHDRRWSLKCRNLSASCVERRYQLSARFWPRGIYLMTSTGNGQ